LLVSRTVYKTFIDVVHYSNIDQDKRVESTAGEGTRSRQGTTGDGESSIKLTCHVFMSA
jgi:hypothetical protein